MIRKICRGSAFLCLPLIYRGNRAWDCPYNNYENDLGLLYIYPRLLQKVGDISLSVSLRGEGKTFAFRCLDLSHNRELGVPQQKPYKSTGAENYLPKVTFIGIIQTDLSLFLSDRSSELTLPKAANTNRSNKHCCETTTHQSTYPPNCPYCCHRTPARRY
jgi:hypothetical protein